MALGQEDVATLRTQARSSGHHRPLFANGATGAIDWDVVETTWVGYQATEGHLVGVSPTGPPQEAAAW